MDMDMTLSHSLTLTFSSFLIIIDTISTSTIFSLVGVTSRLPTVSISILLRFVSVAHCCTSSITFSTHFNDVSRNADALHQSATIKCSISNFFSLYCCCCYCCLCWQQGFYDFILFVSQKSLH